MTFDSFSKGELAFKKETIQIILFGELFLGIWRLLIGLQQSSLCCPYFQKSSKKEKRIWFDPSNFLKNFSKYVNFFQIIVPKIVIANGLKAKEKQIVHVQDLPQCPPT